MNALSGASQDSQDSSTPLRLSASPPLDHHATKSKELSRPARREITREDRHPNPSTWTCAA